MSRYHSFTGDETAHVDDEVAFSGMSTLKIGIVTAIMHKIDGLPKDDPELQTVGQWISISRWARATTTPPTCC